MSQIIKQLINSASLTQLTISYRLSILVPLRPFKGNSVAVVTNEQGIKWKKIFTVIMLTEKFWVECST